MNDGVPERVSDREEGRGRGEAKTQWRARIMCSDDTLAHVN